MFASEMVRPPAAPKRPRIPLAVWELHRSKIEQLYIHEGKSLDQVMAIMLRDFNFSPTHRQYVYRLEKWGFFKYNTGRHVAGDTQMTTNELPHSPCSAGTSLAAGPQTTTDVGMEVDQETKTDAQQFHHVRGGDAAGNTVSIDSKDRKVYRNAENAWETSNRLGYLALFTVVYTMDEDSPMERTLAPITEERSQSSFSEKRLYSLSTLSSGRVSSRTSIEAMEDEISSSRGFVAVPLLIKEQSEGQLELFHSNFARKNDAIHATGKSTFSAADHLTPATPDLEIPPPFTPSEPLGPVEDPIESAMISPAASLTHKVSPLAFLHTIKALNVQGAMTEHDLRQIKSLAELLSIAQSYEDAFQLDKFALLSILDQKADDEDELYRSNESEELKYLLLDATKNATTPQNCRELATLVKRAWAKQPALRECSSFPSCLQRSHFARTFPAKEWQAAQKQCHYALNMHDRLPPSGFPYSNIFNCRDQTNYLLPGHQAVLITNALSLDHGQYTESEISLLRWQQFVDPTPQKTEVALSDCLEGCMSFLADDELVAFLEGINAALWSAAPNSATLLEFETTVIFYYLWSGWKREQKTCRNITDYKVDQTLCGAAFPVLESHCGIGSMEALVTLARMIVSKAWVMNEEDILSHGYREVCCKATLARRAFLGARLLAMGEHLHSSASFLKAYVTPLDGKGSRFYNSAYASLVWTFVHGFIETHFDFRLTVGAFHDSRVRLDPNRSPFSPSFTPTMLPSPRSSWWGSLRSASSLSLSKTSTFSKRKGSIDGSLTSKVSRWSQISLALSMATTASRKTSASHEESTNGHSNISLSDRSGRTSSSRMKDLLLTAHDLDLALDYPTPSRLSQSSTRSTTPDPMDLDF